MFRKPIEIDDKHIEQHLQSEEKGDFLYVEEPVCDHLSLVEQYKANMTEFQLHKMYQEGKTKEVRVLAGLALGYGTTHINVHELIHHPIELVKSMRHHQ